MLRVYLIVYSLIYCTRVTNSWVTLKAVLTEHTEVFDASYIDYNITETVSGAHDVYIHIRKSNMRLFTNVAIDLESEKNQFGIQFMNKTFNTCRFYNSRRYEPLLQLIYNVLLEHPTSLLPRKCPIKTGLYYYLNASLETNKIPPIATGARAARFSLRYFVNEKNDDMKSILWLKFYFKLQRK